MSSSLRPCLIATFGHTTVCFVIILTKINDRNDNDVIAIVNERRTDQNGSY